MFSVLIINSLILNEKYLFDFTVVNLHENIGIEYLVSFLDCSSFNVHVYNLKLNHSYQLQYIIKKYDIKLVGCTINSHSFNELLKILCDIKKNNSKIHINIGGHLATCAAEEILKEFDSIDSIVYGFGEKTIVELAQALKTKVNWKDIKGIIYKEDDHIVKNSPNTFNINSTIFPDRSNLIKRKTKNQFPVARMISSRGCPYNCIYCTTPPFLKSINCHKWLGRSPENVIKEMDQLVFDYGVKQIVFCDDNFIGPNKNGRERARHIAELIIQRNYNIHLWIMVRVDSFENDNDALFKFFKKAGLWGVFLGVESGSQKQLKLLNKKTSVKQNLRAVKLFKSNNIMVELGFIMFYPYSTIKDIEMNAEFLLNVNEANIFNYFTNSLELYPGIAIIKDLRKDGLLKPDFNYKNIKAYYYKTPYLKNFILAIQKIGKQAREVDEIIWNLKRLSTVLGLLYEQYKIMKKSDIYILKNINAHINTIMNDVSKKNFNYFMNALEEFKLSHNIKKNLEYDSQSMYELIIKLKPDMNLLSSTYHEFEDLPDGYVLPYFFDSDIYKKWFE